MHGCFFKLDLHQRVGFAPILAFAIVCTWSLLARGQIVDEEQPAPVESKSEMVAADVSDPTQTPALSVQAYLDVVSDTSGVSTLAPSNHDGIFNVIHELAAVDSKTSQALVVALLKHFVNAHVTPLPEWAHRFSDHAAAKAVPLTSPEQVRVTQAAVKLVAIFDGWRIRHQTAPGDDPSLPNKLLDELAKNSPTLTARVAAATALMRSALELDARTDPLSSATPEFAAKAMNDCVKDLLPACMQYPDTDNLAAMVLLCSGNTMDQWLRIKAMTLEQPNDKSLAEMLDAVAKAAAVIKTQPVLGDMKKSIEAWEQAGLPILRQHIHSYTKVFAEFRAAEKDVRHFFDAVNKNDKQEACAYLHPSKAAQLQKTPSALAMFGAGVTHMRVLRVHYTGRLGDNPHLLLFVLMKSQADEIVKVLDVTMKFQQTKYIFAQ